MWRWNVLIKKDELIEKVCGQCPATLWGKKSICSVHNLHVGKINNCPEWDKYAAEQQGLREDDIGQLSFTDLEPAIEILQRTEDDIKDYRYILIEIDRIRRYLEDAGEGTVGQYGIEAGQPRGKGATSDKTHAEAVRRERKWRRLEKLQEAVERIHKAAETITDERERIVLEALLDGEKNYVIAKLLGLSQPRYYEIRRSVIIKMAWAMYGSDAA
jgi:hypothetical protein